MRITAIKAQVKHAGRVSIFVDEAYAFSLSHTQLLEQKIFVGKNITPAELTEYKNQSELGKAFERALHYVTLRPRSRLELENYARRKKWPPQYVREVMQKCEQRGYINDAAFARSWVRSRALAGKTSMRKLRIELKQKGVADAIIAEAMHELAYSDTEALQSLITKKRRLTRYATDDQKLIQYLMRQGFMLDDIKSALNH